MTTGRRLSIALPEKFADGLPSLPSANVVTRWNFGGQRWRFQKMRTNYANAVLEAIAARGLPWGRPCARARVTVERIAARMLDSDNATAGCKGLVDQLVKSGIIEGDDPSRLDLVVTQRIVKKVRKGKGAVLPEWRGVLVTVEEVGGA